MSYSSDHPVRDLVARADRQKRVRALALEMRRLAPAAAGGALLTAVVGWFLGWSPWVAVGILGLAAAGLAGYAFVQQRERSTTDAIALSVDADAGLAGELRSAHWFESQADRDEWAAYHLDVANRHAGAVDWTTLYPKVPAARNWLLAGIMSVAVVAFAVRIPARAQTPATDASSDIFAQGQPGAALPKDLQEKLAALLAQIDAAAEKGQGSEVPLAELKDLMAKLDPALQKKLEEMLSKKALTGDAQKNAGNLDQDERADRAENATAGLPEDVKWALENAAARMAQSNPDRQTAEKNPSASNQTGEMSMQASAQAQMEAAASKMGAPMLREAAEDPGGKMMMGGGGPMGGDSRAGAGGNKEEAKGAAEALLVAQALRKELVEASADALGQNVEKEDLRRKTEQGKSSLGFTRVAPPRSFEPSRATAPPPVPEARRPLLFNYFIRKR